MSHGLGRTVRLIGIGCQLLFIIPHSFQQIKRRVCKLGPFPTCIYLADLIAIAVVGQSQQGAAAWDAEHPAGDGYTFLRQ